MSNGPQWRLRWGRGASGFSTAARLLLGSAPGLPTPHYEGGLPHPGVWPSVQPPWKAAGRALARTTRVTLFCPLRKKSDTSHRPRETWKTLALGVAGICPAHFCTTVLVRLWCRVLCSKRTRALGAPAHVRHAAPRPPRRTLRSLSEAAFQPPVPSPPHLGSDQH